MTDDTAKVVIKKEEKTDESEETTVEFPPILEVEQHALPIVVTISDESTSEETTWDLTSPLTQQTPASPPPPALVINFHLANKFKAMPLPPFRTKKRHQTCAGCKQPHHNVRTCDRIAKKRALRERARRVRQ